MKYVHHILMTIVALWGSLALGVCPPQWTSTFASCDAGGTVNAAVIFDDGTGPALYVGGSFTTVNGVTMNRVAKYDGHVWTALGPGFSNSVNALYVWNNQLYAGGTFTASGSGGAAVTCNRVARWTGSAWTSLGTGTNNGLSGTVNALTAYNGELYVAGLFASAGTTTGVANIARWNGTSWNIVGSGFNAEVNALKVYNDGASDKLVAGGIFTTSGALTGLNCVARWDGSVWSSMGLGFTGGTTPAVNAFEVYAGSLFAGGAFTTSGLNSLSNVGRWSGTAWVDVAGGVSGGTTPTVNALFPYNDGSGNALYVGGTFTTAGGGAITTSPRLVRWNGAAWSGVGGGVNSSPLCFASFNDSTGTALVMGGAITSVGPTGDAAAVSRLVKWNGVSLSSLGRGISGAINALVELPGTTPTLLAVGDFTRAGNQSTEGVATWNGSGWTILGSSAFNATPTSAAYFNSAIYVGGNFTTYGAAQVRRVARWDGSTFVEVGGNLNGAVNAFVAHNGSLYAAGAFSTPTGRVAVFSGNTWVNLGSGVNNTVNDAISYGNRLIVTGSFTTAGGIAGVNRIAQWDGTTWSALGTGLNNTGNALAVYRGELYVAGDFTNAGTAAASHVARWDGANWSDVGGGMDAAVEDLVVINENGEETLYAVGSFITASGSPANRVAYWNGCRWIAAGSGLGVAVTRVGAVNSGPAKGVYIPGAFSAAGGLPAHNLAFLATCTACAADLDDGTATGRPDGGVTIEDLLFFLAAYEAGNVAADLDDGSGDGPCDGAVTIDDLLFFLAHYEGGC